MKYFLLGCIFLFIHEKSWSQITDPGLNTLPGEITVEALQHRIDSLFSEYVHCASAVKLDKKNMNLVHNPYELTFISKIPRNNVDSFVQAYFAPDYEMYKAGTSAVKQLGQGRSKEAFNFLYLCCAVENQKDIQNNLFHNMSNQVVIWGAFKVLNTCFLNGEVPEGLPELKFRKKVLECCEKLNPAIFFCHQPTIMELYAEEMKGIRTKKYDRKIIRIIKRNNNLRKGNNVEMIQSGLLKLPFIKDVLWDGCYETLLIYPSYHYLVVKMAISGKIVERYYYMRDAKIRFIGLRFGKHFSFGRSAELNKHKLDYRHCGYSPGYIKAARKHCKEKDISEKQDK